jgi:hypothetical protein
MGQLPDAAVNGIDPKLTFAFAFLRSGDQKNRLAQSASRRPKRERRRRNSPNQS